MYEGALTASADDFCSSPWGWLPSRHTPVQGTSGRLHTEPESEEEVEEKKPVVEVLVPSPVKPLTPKKLWEKKKARRFRRSEVCAQPGAQAGAQPREADVAPPQLRVHQRNVEKYYGECHEIHDKILDLVETDEVSKQQEEKWLEFEQLYNRTLVALEMLLTAHERPAQVVLPAVQAAQQVIIHQQALRAPLPTFDGRYENWSKFKAMFQDLMRNSSDSDAVKLYHLDKALVGEAEGKIDLRTIQDNNYRGAWKELEEQYENTRLIIDLHIQGILQLKKMDKRSSTELRDVVERCSRHVEGLRFHKQELLGVSELIVVNILAAALDRETRELWEATIEKGELPTYQATVDFLRKRCHILERCELSDPEASAVKPTVSKMPSATKPSVNVFTAATTTSEVVCELCGGNHPNYKCSAFCSMSVPQRLEKVREARACYNCLRTGHLVRKCPSERTCKCGERHHNLLHKDSPKEQASPKSEAAPKPPPATEQAANGSSNENADASEEQTTSCCNSGLLQTSRPVLLQTAVVNVVDKQGRLHPCRALLDSGSQAHILSAAMARKLELPLTKCNVMLIGANAVKTPARSSVILHLSSRYTNFRDRISCLISEKPTGIIPSVRIDTSGWKIPSGVRLADPQFFEPNDIDLVIASNYVWDLLRSDKVKLLNGAVTLRETDLGWIVTGTYDPLDQVSLPIVHSNNVRLDILEDAVEELVSVEELTDSTPPSAENFDKLVSPTHRSDESSRCVVQLPFRNTVDDQSQALRRFTQLERSRSDPPGSKSQYSVITDNTAWADPLPEGMMMEWLECPRSLDELNDITTPLRGVEPDAVRSEDKLPPKTVELIDDPAPSCGGLKLAIVEIPSGERTSYSGSFVTKTCVLKEFQLRSRAGELQM
ncbi:uncharacterized protein LOC120425683 [Culex pipiens pallens]|uniref:uncharacterized protein LOC120425683 n=1 Tax=Culex pipiens pallens TaxID=42434 RepID=UPI001953910E|nr:uncharacterized protein LOC120425683 [Culex pipiens pallens]